MAITISDGTTTINLPPDLLWQDELWSPVAQSAEYSIAGALMVQTGLMRAGRPITLTGDTSTCWIERETLLALMAYAAAPGQVFTLAMHGEEYRVIMRHQDVAIEAEPVPVGLVVPLPDGQMYNNFILRLMAV